jgi:hypothetical protein
VRVAGNQVVNYSPLLFQQMLGLGPFACNPFGLGDGQPAVLPDHLRTEDRAFDRRHQGGRVPNPSGLQQFTIIR